MGTRNLRAFTRVELVIVITVVTVLSIVVLLPALGSFKARSCRVNCVSNLKQIGTAHRLFANDNDGGFVTSATIQWWNGGRYVAGQTELSTCYKVMGGELSSPKVLLCPVDEEFKTREIVYGDFTNLTQRSISYFMGTLADEKRPAMVLSGDRNLCRDLTGNTLFPADGVRTNNLKQTASWHRTTIHRGGGNLAFADGSAQQVNTKTLLGFLAKTGDTNNTILLPKP